MIINLAKLKIPLETGYKDGEVLGYYYKSISRILKDAIWIELIQLTEWVNQQVLEYIDWDLGTEITTYNVVRALDLFAKLGIKPTNCVYDGDVNKEEG